MGVAARRTALDVNKNRFAWGFFLFFPHYFTKFSLLFSTIHTTTHQLLFAALPCERVSRAGCPFITSLQGFSPQSRRLPHTRKAHPAARSELNARARSSSTPKIFDGVLTKENSPPPPSSQPRSHTTTNPPVSPPCGGREMRRCRVFLPVVPVEGFLFPRFFFSTVL